MSSEAAILIEGLGKSYAINATGNGSKTLREAIVERTRHPFRRRQLDTFWALRNVDLEVAPGEVIGIIGGNGAGKSTLLKLLSRITEPTEGRAEMRGRVGSLLEVGTGFHPELTGRENVFLNGTILGMRRAEIERLFDEIVEFAGIGVFLDTPVKRYSSGMYVRLAFAVAAHLQPDILIIDEVLAVGDAEFQQRCLGTMESAAKEGRTILFVSHNLAAVESLCTRAITLRDGSVSFSGSVDGAIEDYLNPATEKSRPLRKGDLTSRHNPHRDDGRPIVEAMTLVDHRGHQASTIPLGGDLRIQLQTRGLDRVRQPVVGVRIRTPANSVVASASTRMTPLRYLGERSNLEGVTVEMKAVMLMPGDYWVDFTVKDGTTGEILDRSERAVSFTIAAADVFGTGYQPSSADGQLCILHSWTMAPLMDTAKSQT